MVWGVRLCGFRSWVSEKGIKAYSCKFTYGSADAGRHKSYCSSCRQMLPKSGYRFYGASYILLHTPACSCKGLFLGLLL